MYALQGNYKFGVYEKYTQNIKVGYLFAFLRGRFVAYTWVCTSTCNIDTKTIGICWFGKGDSIQIQQFWCNIHVSHEKKRPYFPLKLVVLYFFRDPYVGLWYFLFLTGCFFIPYINPKQPGPFFSLLHCKKKRQGGPMPVISGVIAPISRVITPVTHLYGHRNYL